METLPPYAGLLTSAEARRDGLPVADATGLLHRLAYAKQRLAITAAAFLPSTPEWEAKCALALHAWIDADHAARLYARIAELREPAPVAADVPDDTLRDAFDELLGAGTTAERIGALYGAARLAVRSATQLYLAKTNPLCDQPTVRLLDAILAEEAVVDRFAVPALAAVAGARADDWRAHVTSALAAAGGVDGFSSRATAPVQRHTRPYRLDITPARDERFDGIFDTSTPADVVYLDDTRGADERNAALMFKRLREMDVPEVIAGVVAQVWADEQNNGVRGRPWSWYAALLRQMWDEARHAMLGQAMLEAHDVAWTRLPVNITFSWKLARYCSPVERHILLYAIEQSLMPRDRGKPYEHRVATESGDALSRLFHDFDWADEVLHVDIARRCLKPELPGGLAEARARADELWARIEQRLAAEPPHDGRAVEDWWPQFVQQVTGRTPAPVGDTHVAHWRPE